jgi:hypothetical protein
MGQLSEQFAGLLERTQCADGGALNMHVAIFVRLSQLWLVSRCRPARMIVRVIHSEITGLS